MAGAVFDTFFLIFCSAAVLASLALYTKQPLIVAYVAVGIILGPFGLEKINQVDYLLEMSHIGIIFLLFLLGLDMQPRALLSVLSKATSVTIISSAGFALIGLLVGIAFNFSVMESLVIAMASMFSSTIVGIKLLPTTVLHHRHAGELMVGLLLVQDFIAIFCLLILLSGNSSTFEVRPLLMALAGLPLLVGFAYLFVRYVFFRLIARFDQIHEYIFLIAIGWCLGLAHLAEVMKLSAEVGAFIAGISLATSPISQYIALSLKPLRDFFLVLFFFALGAQLNIDLLPSVIIIVFVYTGLMLISKPLIFYGLLRQQKEEKSLSWDISFRLGQISEFSLLIAFVAFERSIIGERASLLIQCAAIISFIISSYIVIFNFPNPVAVSNHLRRD